jgi:diguanylate cyclase (GGDEF)-like protein/PAS domain S-box-containing protein
MMLDEISFFQIAETASDIIVVTTPDLDAPGPTIVYVNPAFTRLSGYSVEEAIGQSPRILQGEETDRATLNVIKIALRTGKVVHELVLNYSKFGESYWLDLRIVPLRNNAGEISHFAAIQRDVTSEKLRVDELERVALRDALTGIPNRRALIRVVEAAIDTAEKRHAVGLVARGPSLAFIDVDHFKRVNDRYGHEVGDQVLVGIADRLNRIVRREETLGRLGGEEFALCLPLTGLREAEAAAERFRLAVQEAPFETSAGLLFLTVSIGVTLLQGRGHLGTDHAALGCGNVCRQARRPKSCHDVS